MISDKMHQIRLDKIDSLRLRTPCTSSKTLQLGIAGCKTYLASTRDALMLCTISRDDVELHRAGRLECSGSFGTGLC
jgi:hypothetical protein